MTLQNLDCDKFYSIDLIEAERVAEQVKLDASKSSIERNRLGQFATPSSLAIEIFQYSKTLLPNNEEIRFLDPAIGTGSLYSALLKLFPIEQIKSAVGYEIDKEYARVARKLWSKTCLQVCIADFTESVPHKTELVRANLLVCNPPYIRHHHLSKEKKIALKELGKSNTGIELSGLAGLYCYFLLAAHSWMAKDGIACWIIPSEFMDVNYGKKLKKYLLEQVTLLRIHRFAPDDLQFGDALVSTSALWFRNTKPDSDYSVDFTFAGTIDRPNLSIKVSSKKLKELSKWNYTSIFMPRQGNRKSKIKFFNLFEIKRGVATGANNFFILPPERIDILNLPSEFLVPILPSPRHLLNDEILSDEQGNPRLERKLFLLTCRQPMEWLKFQYPSVYSYLEQGETLGISDRYLCRHRSLWYLQETRDPAIILCPYMGRTAFRNVKPFRFILNHSQAIAPNVYLMLYPKGTLKDLLSNNPEQIKSVWTALNSIPIQTLIHEGRVYGDGLHKLEPRELANAPADILLDALEM